MGGSRKKNKPVHEPRVLPFIKWAGGKGQLLQQFQPFFPETLRGRGYVEPFMGSGAVFFHVLQTRQPSRCTLLDANPELVNLFVQVRDHLDPLLELLQAHKEAHNRPGITVEERKAYYYDVRAAAPEPGSLEAAARFLYLNKTCFNGLHRMNRKGQFNVPMGSYKNPSIFEVEHLRAASLLLQGVTIAACSYAACEPYIQDGDFVYFDPPYEPLSRTSSFTSYAREVFTAADQVALRDLAARIAPRCEWMLSNSTAPLIEELFEQPGMFKDYVQASRSINCVAGGRGKIRELLVRNYRTASEHALAASPVEVLPSVG